MGGGAGWETRLTGRDVNEKGVVRYEIPVLVLDRREAEVSLVPAARKVPGADGLVDFYVMPDFDDGARLYREARFGFFAKPLLAKWSGAPHDVSCWRSRTVSNNLGPAGATENRTLDRRRCHSLPEPVTCTRHVFQPRRATRLRR